MDSFWVEISGKRIDIWWLVKVRVHLGKAKKEQHGIKRKKLPTLLDISNLKKNDFWAI